MRLTDALNVKRGEMVAFVGAGGKTSALRKLADELREATWRVLATTTTRLAISELSAFPVAIARSELRSLRQLSKALTQSGLVLVYEEIKNEKVIGVSPEWISQLADNLDSDAILIEADGSRQLPLKVPYAHEPVLPMDVSLVVPVVGLDVIGQPLNEQHVYNPEAIIQQLGFLPHAPIQTPWIAQILRDESLGLRGIPETAQIIPLLNKAHPSMLERIKTRRAAQLILQNPRIQGVAIGRVQEDNPIWEVQRRVGAIILAGGLSSRMGRSKPLLPWGKQTVIETILGRLMPLRLTEIVVVTGHQAQAVEQLIKPFGVKTVYNPVYAQGEMLSSLQTGLQALSASLSAVMIFLGDQPQVNPRLINDLLIAYGETQGRLVAPSYQMRRGHPILIDRFHWRELLELPAGSAPRQVINHYPVTYVITEDANIILDMDTPEEYHAALKRAGLHPQG